MNPFPKLAFGVLLTGSLACAQTAAQPGASAAVSRLGDNSIENIEPVRPATSSLAETETVADPASLLPSLPRVPGGHATLIGGTITKLDRVRDQVTLNLFGGGRTSVLFDPRTRISRDGKDASASDLREGDRVYVDTMLDGNTVFAKSIRVRTTQTMGESQGVVLKYSADRGELSLRDSISPTPVHIQLIASTKIVQGDRAVPASALAPGTLINVGFNADGSGRGTARQISILALPGTRYTFTGQVVHLDLRNGLLVVSSATDRKTYEIYLDPSLTPDENLHAGAVVTAVTTFEGSRYVARSLSIDSQPK